MATTRLSITATPGRNYAGFVAKTPTTDFPKGVGLMTELQVYALPGQRHAFVAKGEAPPVIPPVTAVEEEIMGPPDRAMRYAQAHREDEEILTFILNATTSGILEN